MDSALLTTMRNVRIAAQYATAYEAVHGVRPPVSYNRGWFAVGETPVRVRPRKLREMTEALQALV